MSSPQIISHADKATISKICDTYSLSHQEFSALRTKAVDAKATAYCPYSQFRVGAVVLSSVDNGEVRYTPGANVENASYPVGTCAERVALGRAVTEGVRGGFRALGVATDISPPASPCGMCRQFIREFLKLDTPIFMFDKNEDFVVMKLEELLPMSFGPDQLPRPGAAS